MPRKPRGKFKKGGHYHIYNRGNRKKLIFRQKQDRAVFEGLLRKYLEEYNMDTVLVGHCLMDNHYHLLLRQGFKTPISKIMQRLLTAYVKYFNCKYDLVGHVFQGRYKSSYVPEGLALMKLLKYFENNPVKAGYVDNSDHYAWLSVPDTSGTDIPRDGPL